MMIVKIAINVSRDFQTAEPALVGLEFDTLIPLNMEKPEYYEGRY